MPLVKCEISTTCIVSTEDSEMVRVNAGPGPRRQHPQGPVSATVWRLHGYPNITAYAAMAS
jgi:hypothetical protein